MSSQDTGLLTQFSELDAGTLKSLLTHAADVLLFVSEDGLINDIIGDAQLLDSIGASSWGGQFISDALPGDACAQFREFLSDASKWPIRAGMCGSARDGRRPYENDRLFGRAYGLRRTLVSYWVGTSARFRNCKTVSSNCIG